MTTPIESSFEKLLVLLVRNEIEFATVDVSVLKGMLGSDSIDTK